MGGPFNIVERPPVNPRDHYRRLRALWALSFQKTIDVPIHIFTSFLYHPFVRDFQPSQALAHLYRNNPETKGSYKAYQLWTAPSSLITPHSTLLLAEWAQLALLWVLGGEQEEAESLIQWLFPLLKHPTLWAKESVYDEEEFILSLHLLYSYIGVDSGMNSVSSRPIDPFFSLLAQNLVGKSLRSSMPDTFREEALGVWVNDRASLTLSGYGTALGAFQGKKVEVRAYGPQFYPLTDLELFGVQGIHPAQSIDEMHVCGWTCCFGQSDVWLQAAMSCGNIGREGHSAFPGYDPFWYRLDIRWTGISPEKKGAFVFYVKGHTAHVGVHTLHSNSLQRYKGHAEKVSFNEGAFVIMCSQPQELEIIPLAGKGCFWGADFLLAFTVNPFNPAECFYICCH